MSFTFDELSSKAIGAAIEVHRQLGPGFLESAYEQALRIELSKRNLRFESQKPVQLCYAGHVIGSHIMDVVVENCLVLELKAISSLEDIHFAQLRSYLRASGIKVGLLINFNTTTLTVKRVVYNYEPAP